MKPSLVLAALVWAPLACVTESHRVVESEKVAVAGTQYNGPRQSITVGRFANQSPYMNGLFSDGTDRLGTQAKTILKTHLAQSGRFVVFDRDNSAETGKEAQLSGQGQTLAGAKVVIAGEVTEFGRRETGDKQLFGIAGRGKEQLAYTKVSVNVVDVATEAILFSVQGAGEYTLNDREVLGFGSSSAYDTTLNGKVLNLAITNAVDQLVAGLEAGQWSPDGAH